MRPQQQAPRQAEQGWIKGVSKFALKFFAGYTAMTLLNTAAIHGLNFLHHVAPSIATHILMTGALSPWLSTIAVSGALGGAFYAGFHLVDRAVDSTKAGTVWESTCKAASLAYKATKILGVAGALTAMVAGFSLIAKEWAKEFAAKSFAEIAGQEAAAKVATMFATPGAAAVTVAGYTVGLVGLAAVSALGFAMCTYGKDALIQTIHNAFVPQNDPSHPDFQGNQPGQTGQALHARGGHANRLQGRTDRGAHVLGM